MNVHDPASTRLAAQDGPRSRLSQADPVARVVDAFAAAWRQGERPRAETFLARHPLLATRPEAAIRLIYEEVCLRQDEGESVPLPELAARFPQWQTELAVLLDCDRLIGATATAPDFPGSGDHLGDFLLLAELGRGARGRCFLASQPSLSDRRVALKVTTDDQVEHLSMARLQHTHIMPLYSEHVLPERRLRALCMPYLGGATLARILDELAAVPSGERSGRSLVQVLARAQQAIPWPGAGETPARRFLSQATYVRAVCWIGTCLADALQYAHERGLVHMDVKPSNILLTADGQPMLLDFHLARPLASGGVVPGDGVGGTPGYMSPEQEAAIAAMDAGKPVPRRVDARSDVYSLGCVLAAMLGLGDRTPPDVSTGLADIVGKCRAAAPSARYRDAAALADDLRRHMADLPLAGVPNRSLAERWWKWRRRQPHALFPLKVMLYAATATAALAVLGWSAFLAPRFREASTALAEGRDRLDRGEYAEAARALTRGAALIENIPGGDRLERELADALRRSDRLAEADRLHRLVDHLRLAESSPDRPGRSARDVERHVRAVWASRHALLDGSGFARVDEPLRDDLLDLAVIGSTLRVRLETDPSGIARAHRAGLELLDEAEALCGPSHVLYLARRSHAEALGMTTLAAVASRDAARVPPRTAWEHAAAGRVLLASGDLAGAEAAFARAIELRPQDFWPNFHQGVCAYRRARYADAVSAFRVGIALAPDRAEGYFNRALAEEALGLAPEAARDFRRAAELDPTLAAARPGVQGRGLR